jgi:phosphoglycerate dehydrogenase-like enzyme
MKILYSLAWEIDPFEPILDTFPGITLIKAQAKNDFGPTLEDADGIILSATHYNADVAKELKERGKKLRWMQSAAIGYDNYVNFGIPDGVTLCNAAGLKGGTVSEHAFSMMIALRHGIHYLERYRSKKEWQNVAARENITPLDGRTIAIIGYGSIGKELGRKAKAFDMNVIGISRSGQGDEHADQAVKVDQMLDVLPQADIVAAALPSNPESKNLIDAKAFKAMKPGALFVNVGRGLTMDQSALIEGLQNGHLSGAGLDVFEVEPLAEDSPLWTMDNVILSPHIAGTGDRTYALFVELLRKNFELFKKGEPLLNEVPAALLKS